MVEGAIGNSHLVVVFLMVIVLRKELVKYNLLLEELFLVEDLPADLLAYNMEPNKIVLEN
jgi:hypothetical protein